MHRPIGISFIGHDDFPSGLPSRVAGSASFSVGPPIGWRLDSISECRNPSSSPIGRALSRDSARHSQEFTNAPERSKRA